MCFPGGSDNKESAYNAGDLGSTPGLGRSPGVEHGNPRQYSCLESLHGQRSLVGSAVRGVTKSHDYTTEGLNTAQRTVCDGRVGRRVSNEWEERRDPATCLFNRNDFWSTWRDRR